MTRLFLLFAMLFCLSCEEEEQPSNNSDEVPDPMITAYTDFCSLEGSAWDYTTNICWITAKISYGVYDSSVSDQYNSVTSRFDDSNIVNRHVATLAEAITLVRNCDLRECPLANANNTESKYLEDPKCAGCFGSKPFIDTDLTLPPNRYCYSLYTSTPVADLPGQVWMLHITEDSLDIIHVSDDVAIFDDIGSCWYFHVVYDGMDKE